MRVYPCGVDRSLSSEAQRSDPPHVLEPTERPTFSPLGQRLAHMCVSLFSTLLMNVLLGDAISQQNGNSRPARPLRNIYVHFVQLKCGLTLRQRKAFGDTSERAFCLRRAGGIDFGSIKSLKLCFPSHNYEYTNNTLGASLEGMSP